MFRDLKEYQEIAKIYADKVSKPEDLEENQANRMKMKATRDANKPKTRAEVGLPPKKKPSPFERKFGKERNEKRMISQGVKKPMPTTDEIRKANPNVVPGTRVNEIGAQGGGKPSEGDFKKDFPDKKPLTTKQKFDKKFIKKDKGVGFVKRGTAVAQRAENKEKNKMRAQEMAKKRIAAKESGTAPTPMSGKERAQAMAKARIAAKKAAMEEYTPYDYVLEYLLSSEQAATIEEANYVMTEMDAETIQGIVEEQKKTLDEMDMMKMPVVNVLGGLAGAVGGTVAAAKYLGRKAGERSIKKTEPKKPGLVKTIKDRTDTTNKAIEKM